MRGRSGCSLIALLLKEQFASDSSGSPPWLALSTQAPYRVESQALTLRNQSKPIPTF